MFMDAVRDNILENHNVSITENGAIGYETTGKNLLDLNFSVASLRNVSEAEIAERFYKAFLEDKNLAMRWLFFARDVRGGLGERRLFRAVIEALSMEDPEVVKAIIPLVPEYGRYDDLWCLLDTPVKDVVISFVAKQFESDITGLIDRKQISLLGKWAPSPSASSRETKRYAKIIAKGLGLTERDYRKGLSKIRKYLDVVEVKMSAKRWDEINYEAVPSRANLIYNNAFLRNDEERRQAYLESLKNGEAKINASVLYPHDIVHKYIRGHSRSCSQYDETLEQLWKNLPNTVNENGNTLVVCDGSGSMECQIGGTTATALEVANALAIYFAERSSGQFKNKFITFSSKPKFVDISSGKTLRDKIHIAMANDDCSNTNIEKTFDLILDVAVKNHMKQEDLPKNILIISDMEFDSATSRYYGWDHIKTCDKTLFSTISKKFEDSGYKMPRLVFWNVNSRTETIPVRENELGVALVSGFSVNVCKMVMSGEIDPYKCLLDAIMDKRYDAVSEAVKEVI